MGGLVVFQGTPHWEGYILPFLGHVFSSVFLLGFSVLSELNEIIVTSLPFNYGCCSSAHMCGRRPGVGLWGGTWQPRYLMAPEPGFLRSGGFQRLSFHAQVWRVSWGPARSSTRGSGQCTLPPHTRLAHTDKAVVCSLSFPPLLEYKKKYGAEHGSCQAGIAGFFTEVGVSCLGISVLLGVFISLLVLI